MLTQGRIDEGAHFLECVSPTWTELNSFMLTHLWWHVALFKLSQGCFAQALEIYDRHCWGVAKDYSQDQVGAVSLLARLEIAGVDVGSRWQELAGYLVARAGDTVQPFLTLQYLYGLARARRARSATRCSTPCGKRHGARTPTCASSGRRSCCPRARDFMSMRREDTIERGASSAERCPG